MSQNVQGLHTAAVTCWGSLYLFLMSRENGGKMEPGAGWCKAWGIESRKKHIREQGSEEMIQGATQKISGEQGGCKNNIGKQREKNWKPGDDGLILTGARSHKPGTPPCRASEVAEAFSGPALGLFHL